MFPLAGTTTLKSGIIALMLLMLPGALILARVSRQAA